LLKWHKKKVVLLLAETISGACIGTMMPSSVSRSILVHVAIFVANLQYYWMTGFILLMQSCGSVEVSHGKIRVRPKNGTFGHKNVVCKKYYFAHHADFQLVILKTTI
jgi:hypothetical protein